MKELARSEEYLYILERREDGAVLFTVTCGGVGMYDVTVQLSDAEMKHYADEGGDFLDRLALEIGKDSARFAAQAVER